MAKPSYSGHDISVQLRSHAILVVLVDMSKWEWKPLLKFIVRKVRSLPHS
eukprot:m.1618393 g.1618393  ORF g.1618393 m.1618393 type:complete len:50 (+) comp25377_c0_seq9:3806-3955(+)